MTMHIVRITPHPNSADLIIAKTPPTMASIMGRFEPARRSQELNGYLISTADLAGFARFLRIHNIAVSDERNTGTPTAPPFTREPFGCIKCWDCDYTQRGCDKACGHCETCHDCGSRSIGAHTIDADEQREINARGLAKIRPLLQGWPLRTDDEPAAARAALHAARKDTP
jgi:hypothetical protein